MTFVLPLHTASWGEMANRHALGDTSVLPVRVSLGKPKFWPLAASLPYVHELAPAGLLGLPWAEFEPAYVQRLNAFGVERIAQRFEAIHAAYCRPLALCCFEAHRSDCHRDLLAEWLEQHDFGAVHEIPSPTGRTRAQPRRTREPAHNPDHA